MPSNREKDQKVDTKPADRPRYEPPRIRVMSEREILNTFQLTQSMAGWWSTLAC